MQTVKPASHISYPFATACAIIVLIGGLLPSSQATTTRPQEPAGEALVQQSISLPPLPTVARTAMKPMLAAQPLLEDLPEFAPKFQPVVARKRAMKRQSYSRLDWVFSSTRVSPHPAWL